MLGGRTNHWGRISLRMGPYDYKPFSRAEAKSEYQNAEIIMASEKPKQTTHDPKNPRGSPDGHHDNDSLAMVAAKILNIHASIRIGPGATTERQLKQNPIRVMVPGNRINESGDSRQDDRQEWRTGSGDRQQ